MQYHIDARVHQVYCIKLWVKRRKIHEPYRGYLSSYSYTLMVLFYLQREGVLLCLQDLERREAVQARDPALQVLGKYDCYFYRNVDVLQGIGESANAAPVGLLLLGFFLLLREAVSPQGRGRVCAEGRPDHQKGKGLGKAERAQSSCYLHRGPV